MFVARLIEGRTDLELVGARRRAFFRITAHEPSGTSSGGPFSRADLGGDALVVGFRMEFDLN